MVARFYIKNGKIADFEKNSEYALPFLSKTFEISEEIWFCFNELPLFQKHISSLQEQINLLQLPKHAFINDSKELLRVSKRLINKNKAFKSGVLNYLFFWNNGKTDVYITCQPNEAGHFPLIQKAILCTYAEKEKYSKNPWGSFRFKNEPTWNTLQWKIENSRFQNMVITNENNVITECIKSNVFFIKKDTLFTPSKNTGCYIDHIRELILDAAKNQNLRVEEKSDLSQENILEMEEAFLASETLFMEKIIGINDKRFIHNKTVLINTHLNNLFGIA